MVSSSVDILNDLSKGNASVCVSVRGDELIIETWLLYCSGPPQSINSLSAWRLTHQYNTLSLSPAQTHAVCRPYGCATLPQTHWFTLTAILRGSSSQDINSISSRPSACSYIFFRFQQPSCKVQHKHILCSNVNILDELSADVTVGRLMWDNENRSWFISSSVCFSTTKLCFLDQHQLLLALF